jgi:hypothetical protein
VPVRGESQGVRNQVVDKDEIAERLVRISGDAREAIVFISDGITRLLTFDAGDFRCLP